MMIDRDDRDELEAIDTGLGRLFADEERVPADFTVRVLRRVQEERWQREVWLGRVLYAGLCASGVLVIGGLGVAFGTLPSLSDAAAMRVAVVALVLAGAASLSRLRWAGPT
jgi:hypothetical protein